MRERDNLRLYVCVKERERERERLPGFLSRKNKKLVEKEIES